MVIKFPNEKRIVIDTNNISHYEPYDFDKEYSDLAMHVIDIYYRGETDFTRIFEGEGIEGEKERDAILSIIDKEMNVQTPISGEAS